MRKTVQKRTLASGGRRRRTFSAHDFLYLAARRQQARRAHALFYSHSWPRLSSHAVGLPRVGSSSSSSLARSLTRMRRHATFVTCPVHPVQASTQFRPACTSAVFAPALHGCRHIGSRLGHAACRTRACRAAGLPLADGRTSNDDGEGDGGEDGKCATRRATARGGQR